MKGFNNLIVIGNGFDLNLDLRTSYSDFISSCAFKSLLKGNNHIAEDLIKSISSGNWIDIEKHLKLFSSETNFPDSVEEHFVAVKDALITYLKTIDIKAMNKQSEAYKLLSSHLSDSLVLDFNYTGAAKEIMRECGMHENEISQRLIQVHGSIEKGDIIFGVEDSADIYVEKHIFLKKSAHPNFNGFDITAYIQSHTVLHIFGHSLGETDRTYFQPYFDQALNYKPQSKHDIKSKINLYYFGTQSWNNLMVEINSMTNNKINVYRKNVDLIPIDTYKPVK